MEIDQILGSLVLVIQIGYLKISMVMIVSTQFGSLSNSITNDLGISLRTSIICGVRKN